MKPSIIALAVFSWSALTHAQSAQPQTAPAETSAPHYTKEQAEEIKKQNTKAEAQNVLIRQVNDAISAKNWQDAIAPLQQLLAADPNNWQYSLGLGDAQFNLAHYAQAADSYQKGIQVLQSNTAVDSHDPSSDPAKRKAGEGHMLTSLGNTYLKLHKNDDAIAAYTKAAAVDPNPAIAYFNLCATEYNIGNTARAMDACDKALTTDPNKADAWFIKGSLLVAESKTDKSGKVIAPPATAEALNKYLELAPDGAHVNDVKQMLDYIGATVTSTYKSK